MATDYTANYNLDKYTANDKPNLRDQYNAAMDKIDTQLLIANNNATLAVTKAQQAIDDVSDAVDDINAVSDAVDDINDTIAHLTDEIFVLVGDSYSEGYIPGGSRVASDGWIYKLKGLVSSTHPNVSFIDGSYNGNQMSGGLVTQTENLINSLNAAQKKKVTKILIAGGYNDARHHAGIGAFDTNFSELASFVKSNCAHADVYISFVGGTITGQTTGVYETTTSAACFVAYLWAKQTSEKYGFIFDDGSYATLIRQSWFYEDKVHPNPTGNEIIARRLFKFLYNGHGFFPALANSDPIPITPNFGGTLEADASFVANFGPDGYLRALTLDGSAATWLRINYETPRVLSFNTGSSINIVSCPIPAVAGIRVKIPVEVLVDCTKSGTRKWYHAIGIISYASNVNNLYLNSCIFDDGSPLNQVDTHHIYIMPLMTYTYPATSYPQ